MFSLFVFLFITPAITVPIAPSQNVIGDFKGSPVAQYSSDFTRDIFIKKIHSHNDYWRDVPLFTALSYGAQSVEADVWHFYDDDQLYVGHHEAALGPQRTLSSAYIDPLVNILTRANPKNAFTVNETRPNGVFDTDPHATLYFFIDVKTESKLCWQYVEKALGPLKDNDWLSYYNGTAVVQRPITVIGTGNTPYEYVKSLKTRYFFNDGPLTLLNEDTPVTLNPIASASLRAIVGMDLDDIAITGLNDEQYAKLNSTVSKAHEMGIQSRVWGVSWWPVEKRNNLWRQILSSGSDFLNADDLKFASEFY
jgi:hypothetical protein